MYVYVKLNIGARSPKHCCSGKARNVTYSEIVFVVSDMQHATRSSILSSVACPFVRHFSTSPHKVTIFEENKKIEHKMCVLIFCTVLSETGLILRRT